MNLSKFYTYKAVSFVVVLVIVFVGFLLLRKSDTTVINHVIDTNTPATTEIPAVTSITKEDIKEENFTGSRPIIVGDDVMAVKAREYIKERVAEFKAQADKDVPDMREQFGADSPTASYTIDIGAEYVKGDKTESIIISVYAYTGGANGNSSYKVITASKQSGAILSLADIIASDQKSAFTELVKKELNNWRPYGSDAPVVFPDEVDKLEFSSFVNFSLDDKNLILYFDKYEIGPGVLGAVAFPVPLSKIQSFLKPL